MALGSDVRILSSHGPREFARLWTIALATYGVGDIVTTIALMEFENRVSEMNFLLESLVGSYGQVGLIGLKLAIFGIAIGVSVYGDRVDDWLLYYFPPAVLAIVGAFAMAFNIRLLLG